MAVQDPTTNYKWALPDIGGNIGSWGTLLNLIFGNIGTTSDEEDPMGIDGVIGELQEQVNTLETEVDALDDRVTTVEDAGGSTALYFKARRGTGQAIPQGTATKVVWDVEEFDEGDIHASGTATVPADGGGLWMLHASITGDFHGGADDSNSWYVEIRVNGLAVASGRTPSTTKGVSSASGDVTVQAQTLVDLEDGDEIEVWVIQIDPGGSGSESVTSGVGSFFEGVRIAPGE